MNRMTDDISGKKRILVVRFSALGDVAMTIPVVYALAAQYPELTIDYVTSPFFARLFVNAPESLRVHGIDLKKYKGFKGTTNLLKQLSALKPDYVADLHNVLRSWIIDTWFRMKGVKVIMVDKMRSSRKEVLNKGKAQESFFKRYAKVFSELGFPVDLNFKTIFPEGIPEVPVAISRPAVGIAPFARYANKTYPIDLMEEVVGNLVSKGISVYLFGARGKEAEHLEKIAEKNKGSISVAGKLPIEDELALMAQMDVMVSMDSANHHLASLSGTPVVSIWGSTTPACGFMGYRQNPENALCLNLDCQPCSIAGKPDCPRKNMECLQSLSPLSVTQKIISLLKK